MPAVSAAKPEGETGVNPGVGNIIGRSTGDRRRVHATQDIRAACRVGAVVRDIKVSPDRQQGRRCDQGREARDTRRHGGSGGP